MAGIFRYNTTNSSTPIRRHTLSPFCTSPGQLQDVTMDNSYAIGYRSPCYGGSTSPGQGRSVREFEEQMAALRKENFNLKLRIYFLEEKIPGYSSSNNNQDGHETLLKQNVDLKVDIEVLRKELQEKQTLLCEAAKAMDLMEKQQKQTEEQSQVIIDELNEKIRYLESENREFEKSPTGQHTLDQLMGRTELGSDIDTVQKIRELEGFVKQYELKTDELAEKINELETTINQKNETIINLETKIKELEYQNSEIQEQLEFKQQEVTNAEHQKLKDELIEYKKQLADKICTLEEVETKLQQKTKEHEKACSAIQKLILNTKNLQIENEKLQKMDLSYCVSQLKENTQPMEASNLKQTLNETAAATAEWTTLRNRLEKLIEEKDGEIKNLKLEVKKKTANLQNLVNKELWEKNREVERLTKLLNKTQSQAASMPSSPTKEIDQLKQSFTDSDYKAALERNKSLQKRVDSLIQRFCTVAEHNPEPLVQQLRVELQEARDNAEKAHRWRKECADVCDILKDRLEELAGFLDSLLEDDVLGALAADKRRAMRKAVNRSLEMSRSLTNMSLSRSRLSMADPGEHSLIQLSAISGLLDFTTENKENRTFNSHVEDDKQGLVMIESLKAEIKALRKELDRKKVVEPMKKERRSLPMNLIENQSESEAWSEPDRKVSLARIGLEESILMKSIASNVKEENRESTTTESESDLIRKSKWCKAQKKISVLEQMIAERDNRILEVQCELVEADNRLKKENLRLIEVSRELEEYKKVNEMLEIEIAKFKTEGNGNDELRFEYEAMKRQLADKENLLEKMQQERDNLNIEIRLTEMKMETLKTEMENLKLNHQKQLEATIEHEQQKLNKMQAELIVQWEVKLKQQEEKFHSNLARDWVSRSLYTDMKHELEMVQKRFSEAQNTIEFLHENEAELNSQLIENEKCIRNLKKNIDDATLQASKAALERTKAMNDKLQLEAKVNELTVKLEKIEQEKLDLIVKLTKTEKSNALLHTKLTNRNEESDGINAKTRKQSSIGSEASGYTSEDVPMTVADLSLKGRRVGAQRHNNSSPDLGIESDAGRTSSAELASMQPVRLLKTVVITSGEDEDEECEGRVQRNAVEKESTNKSDDGVDAVNNNSASLTISTMTVATNTTNTTATTVVHDCAKVEKENEELRRKLRYTKRAFEDTWNKLRSSNQRKEQIERDLRGQIEKTHEVLKNVRTNMESGLEAKKK